MGLEGVAKRYSFSRCFFYGNGALAPFRPSPPIAPLHRPIYARRRPTPLHPSPPFFSATGLKPHFRPATPVHTEMGL